VGVSRIAFLDGLPSDATQLFVLFVWKEITSRYDSVTPMGTVLRGL
jgi:hypothetical protein